MALSVEDESYKAVMELFKKTNYNLCWGHLFFCMSIWPLLLSNNILNAMVTLSYTLYRKMIFFVCVYAHTHFNCVCVWVCGVGSACGCRFLFM